MKKGRLFKRIVRVCALESILCLILGIMCISAIAQETDDARSEASIAVEDPQDNIGNADATDNSDANIVVETTPEYDDGVYDNEQGEPTRAFDNEPAVETESAATSRNKRFASTSEAYRAVLAEWRERIEYDKTSSVSTRNVGDWFFSVSPRYVSMDSTKTGDGFTYCYESFEGFDEPMLIVADPNDGYKVYGCYQYLPREKAVAVYTSHFRYCKWLCEGKCFRSWRNAPAMGFYWAEKPSGHTSPEAGSYYLGFTTLDSFEYGGYSKPGEYTSSTGKKEVLPIDSGIQRIKKAHPAAKNVAWNKVTSAFVAPQKMARIATASITSVKKATYTGKRITQKPVVKIGDKKLSAGRDYKTTYKNNTAAGTASMTVVGKGVYVGSKTVKFKIAKASISSCRIASIGNKKYTGKAIKPKPTVKFGGRLLELGKDYTLSYKNNKNCGNATVIVKGKGNFGGSMEKPFKIVDTEKITISESSVTLNLVTRRKVSLKATKHLVTGSVKWKSSDSSVVVVDKNGTLSANSRGSATVTAYVGKVKGTCKVTVKDTAVVTVGYGSFSDLDSWYEAVRLKELSLVGISGQLATHYDGQTYYTGNIIADRKVIAYKKVDMKVSSVYGPTVDRNLAKKTVHFELPSKARYTLHRHSLSTNMDSKNVGRFLVGLVGDQSLVFTQECSCGLECEVKWQLPVDDSMFKKIEADETIRPNSIVAVQRPK